MWQPLARLDPVPGPLPSLHLHSRLPNTRTHTPHSTHTAPTPPHPVSLGTLSHGPPHPEECPTTGAPPMEPTWGNSDLSASAGARSAVRFLGRGRPHATQLPFAPRYLRPAAPPCWALAPAYVRTSHAHACGACAHLPCMLAPADTRRCPHRLWIWTPPAAQTGLLPRPHLIRFTSHESLSPTLPSPRPR